MHTLKNKIFHNWNFARALRLFLGLMLCYQAIRTAEWPAAVVGLFLLYQSVLNTGCCTGGACAVQHPAPKDTAGGPSDAWSSTNKK